MTEEELQKIDEEIFASIKENNNLVIKRFEKFSIRDVVFLAICSAAALLFSAIMPVVVHVPIYGIIQIAVSLQTSLFLSIGLYKVRKHGALLFMSIFSGIVLVFMAPVMFFIGIISSTFLELLFLISKKGFHISFFRYLATILYIPLQMPVLWIYYYYISSEAVPSSYVNNTPWFIFLTIISVIGINILGTIIGNVIGSELQRAGVLDKTKGKKNDKIKEK